MALFGSIIPSDLGLRVLFCPIGSNVVVRTACCSVGIVLPVYSTYKAIERKDENEQQRWLLYWAVYGSFSIAEVFTDRLLYWFPLYYHMKFTFLVWLQLPSADGARHLYMKHLRPLLLKHQARLDLILGFVHDEMARFMTAHQGELEYAMAILKKILASANKMARSVINSVHGRATGSAEAPAAGEEQPESDIDE